MNRPDLISTFTKIELWRQTQFKRIVYLDADMVALRAPNELLSLDTDFAAVPDIGWPDCFNSGMMVLNPNMSDFYALYALAQRGISFDGADQGLLNMHFRDWERLSFVYNCTPSGHYQYIPAYRHFQSSIAAIHFIGADKPWTLGRENRMNTGIYGELLGMWWSVYDRHYKPKVIIIVGPSNKMSTNSARPRPTTMLQHLNRKRPCRITFAVRSHCMPSTIHPSLLQAISHINMNITMNITRSNTQSITTSRSQNRVARSPCHPRFKYTTPSRTGPPVSNFPWATRPLREHPKISIRLRQSSSDGSPHPIPNGILHGRSVDVCRVCVTHREQSTSARPLEA
jgi:hypothetical protein